MIAERGVVSVGGRGEGAGGKEENPHSRRDKNVNSAWKNYSSVYTPNMQQKENDGGRSPREEVPKRKEESYARVGRRDFL